MSQQSESRAGHACGKVILVGEHAVVYGVPAIAAGVDRGATALATPWSDTTSELYVSGWDVRVRDDGDEHELSRAFASCLQSVREMQRSEGRPVAGTVQVEASVRLPPGGGLGCSAALGVAITRALDPDAPVASTVAGAMAWERIFHGNPSGIDAEVSARGGCIQFRRGEGVTPIRVRSPLYLCVGNTGIASGTKAMVEGVAKLRDRRPEVIDKTFEAIATLTANARGAIEAGDASALGKLLDLNQMLLSSLFVSTPDIERMCELARGNGALGAKLTGAGGGGSVIALVSQPSHSEAILEAWKSAGFSGFAATVSAPEAPAAKAKTSEALT